MKLLKTLTSFALMAVLLTGCDFFGGNGGDESGTTTNPPATTTGTRPTYGPSGSKPTSGSDGAHTSGSGSHDYNEDYHIDENGNRVQHNFTRIGYPDTLPELQCDGCDYSIPFMAEENGDEVAIRYNERELEGKVNESAISLIGEHFARQDIVTLPDTYNGKPITRIISMPTLKEHVQDLTIGKYVTHIDDDAFSSVKYISHLHWNAIEYSKEYDLTTFRHSEVWKVTFGEGVKVVPKSMFYACGREIYGIGENGQPGYRGENYKNPLEEINFNNEVEWIGDGAFESVNIESISVPVSIKYIGQMAFNSERMVYAYLPESVETIGASAFFYTTVVFTDAVSQQAGWSNGFSANVRYGRNQADYYAESLGLYFDVVENEAHVIKCDLKHEDVVVPESISIDGHNYPVTTIDTYAFYTTELVPEWEHHIQSIKLPRSIEKIETNAIRIIRYTGYYPSVRVNMMTTVTTIEQYAVQNAKLYMPFDDYQDYSNNKPSGWHSDGFYMNDMVFDSYSFPFEYGGFEFVLCKTGAKVISNVYDENAAAADPIVIPENVNYEGIDYDVTVIELTHFGSFRQEIHINKSVKRIRRIFADEEWQGEGDFHIVFPEDCLLEVIEDNAFTGTHLSEFDAPYPLEHLREVGSYAFHTIYSGFQLDKMPNLVKIGAHAFEEIRLESVVIPAKVTTIGSCAFAGLSEAYLPFAKNEMPEGIAYDWCGSGSEGPIIYYGATHEKISIDGYYYTYIIMGNEACLVKCGAFGINVVIPDEIEVDGVAYPVTRIDHSMVEGEYFSTCEITGLTVGKNVKYIQDNFFSFTGSEPAITFKDISNIEYCNLFSGTEVIISDLSTLNIAYLEEGTHLTLINCGNIYKTSISSSQAYKIKELTGVGTTKLKNDSLTYFVNLEKFDCDFDVYRFGHLFTEYEFEGSVALVQSNVDLSTGAIILDTETTYYIPESLKEVVAQGTIYAGFFQNVTTLDVIRIGDNSYSPFIYNNTFYHVNIETIEFGVRVNEINAGSFNGASVNELIFNGSPDRIYGLNDLAITKLTLKNPHSFSLGSIQKSSLETVSLPYSGEYQELAFISFTSTNSYKLFVINTSNENIDSLIAASMKSGEWLPYVSGPIEKQQAIDELAEYGITLTEDRIITIG